jgi:hypothetical protein
VPVSSARALDRARPRRDPYAACDDAARGADRRHMESRIVLRRTDASRAAGPDARARCATDEPIVPILSLHNKPTKAFNAKLALCLTA